MKCNLVLMGFIWSSVSLNFWSSVYLVNTFESNVYTTALSISAADVIAYITGAVLVAKFGVKKTIFCSLLLAVLGGFLILTYGLDHQDSATFPILFFVSRFGISCAFVVLYLGNAKIFPEEIVASAMGKI